MHTLKRLIWFLQDIFKVEWRTEKVSAKQVIEMKDIMEIRSYYAWRFRELFGKTRLLEAELCAKCTDPDKIKAIVAAVRNVDTSKDYLLAVTNYLCFKDKSGRFLCIGFSAGHGKQGKTVMSSGYIDETGALYDALQNAGLVGPPLTEQQNPNKLPHSK